MRIASIPDAADHIGVSRYTLARYLREGRIPPLRFGRRVLVDLDALVDRF